VLQAPWFGYVFGLASVLLATVLLLALLPGRPANQSALYALPVLVTASAFGRGPALIASVAAFAAFDWFFAEEPKLDASHWPTLLVLIVIGLVAGQLATMLHERAGEARRRLNEIIGLQQLGATLIQEHDIDRLLQAVASQLKELTDADGVSLALLDEQEQALQVRAYAGAGAQSNLGAHLPIEGSFAGQAVRTNKPVRSEDPQHDPRGYAPALVAADARSVLSVPMRTRHQVVGAVSLFNKRGAAGFSERDAELATLFAQQAAVAIDNARLYEQARGKAALEERQRLARELHDSVSQALYGIALNASSAEELFDAAPERARGLLADVLRLAEAGLTEMRALIFELRPESLEQEGLVGALQKQAASVQARHGLQVELDVAHEPELPAATKEALYRVAQEALHNAVKHARARTLSLALHTGNGEVQLVVVDDGRGFNPREEFPGHLGLRSMRERVAVAGGTFQIDSAPGSGTRLSVRVPL
jgi:signal transduction histidine kinase